MTIDEGIKKLVALAEKQGYIAYRDVNDIFPDVSCDQMDGVFLKLRTLNVEIMDQRPDPE
jgi:hypothetical protein